MKAYTDVRVLPYFPWNVFLREDPVRKQHAPGSMQPQLGNKHHLLILLHIQLLDGLEIRWLDQYTPAEFRLLERHGHHLPFAHFSGVTAAKSRIQ
jgi:hypothetical protein